jgi:apolipoprotein N-acyltransferase
MAPFARVAGGLGLLVLSALLAVGLAEAARARVRLAALTVLVAVAATLLGVVAPDGGDDGRAIDTVLVQGGGPRGFRANETDPADVVARHLEASKDIRGRPDLVMWPEDVIDINDQVDETPEGDELAALADRLDTTLVAGVVEGEGTDHFRNAAVAWDPDGKLVARYEKVRRVPFGEYVPFRSFFERFADLSDVPADAIIGSGPPVLRTPPGRLGVLISFEVFFNDRSRKGVDAGAEVLLVPTNAASFSTSQVPTQELAAAQLRALEAGRWLAQAGPTGYTAFVNPDGEIVERSRLGDQQLLTGRLFARQGRTLFNRLGDVPLIALAILGLLAGLVLQARSAAARPAPD